MDELDFVDAAEESNKILELCNDLMTVKTDLETLDGSYSNVKRDIEKLIDSLNKTKKEDGGGRFEECLYNEAIDACTAMLWNSAHENYREMQRERYMDIIKIFKEWK